MTQAAQPSSLALTQQCLERIAGRDARLHAFIQVTADAALASAKASDLRRSQGALLGALDGVPVAIKDNIDIAGLPTSGGMRHYAAGIARHDATIVKSLRAAGAVIVGKTNLHEAALGATSDNPWFGRCENPLRADFTPGGSSGGSAVAVADGMCVIAIGTDTMGSVRIPAAYCGIAGFKPTRGVLPTDGVMPLSHTLDTVGLLGASATVLASAWRALIGNQQDAAIRPDTWRVAIAKDIEVGQDAAIQPMLNDVANRARAAGVDVSERSLAQVPFVQLRRDAFLLSEIEGADVHAAGMAANPTGFSPPLRVMLDYGARQSPERTMQLRVRLREAAQELEPLLAGVDALLLPTTPQAAFAHGAPVPHNQADYTVLANIAGWPAISIPWGSDADGLPLGLQLIGKAGSDERLLALAAHFETIRAN